MAEKGKGRQDALNRLKRLEPKQQSRAEAPPVYAPEPREAPETQRQRDKAELREALRRAGVIEVPERLAREVGRRALRTERAERELATVQAKALADVTEANAKLRATEIFLENLQTGQATEIKDLRERLAVAEAAGKSGSETATLLSAQIETLKKEHAEAYDAAVTERNKQIATLTEKIQILETRLGAEQKGRAQSEAELDRIAELRTNASEELRQANDMIEQLRTGIETAQGENRALTARELALISRVSDATEAAKRLELQLQQLKDADERAKTAVNENADLRALAARLQAQVEGHGQSKADLERAMAEIGQKSAESSSASAKERAEREKNVKAFKEVVGKLRSLIINQIRATDDINEARAAGLLLDMVLDLLEKGSEGDTLDPQKAMALISDYIQSTENSPSAPPVDSNPAPPQTPPTTPAAPEQTPSSPQSTETIGSDLNRFMQEEVKDAPGSIVRLNDLYNAYAEWCEAQEKEPETMTLFSRALQAFPIRKEKIGGRVTYFDIALRKAPESA
jgi:hypothetical protein